MKKSHKFIAAVFGFYLGIAPRHAEPLFTQEGTDPSIAEFLEKGTVKASEPFFQRERASFAHHRESRAAQKTSRKAHSPPAKHRHPRPGQRRHQA